MAPTDPHDGRRYHIPALVAEVLALLAPEPGECGLDLTLGDGGHAAEIARRLGPSGRMFAVDRDPDAIRVGGAWLREHAGGAVVDIVCSAFSNVGSLFPGTEFDVILADLGVSSRMLDTDRGFTFTRDEELVMLMDPTGHPTAAEYLATVPRAELERILRVYADEPYAKRIAVEITSRRDAGRPLRTTFDMVAAVAAAVPRARQHGPIHPATRTAMAVRMAVNYELQELETMLPAAIGRLAPGGRMAVIAWHSGESRLVKHAFREAAGRLPRPRGTDPAAAQQRPSAPPAFELITRHAIKPSEFEAGEANPRSRSARLYGLRRVAAD